MALLTLAVSSVIWGGLVFILSGRNLRYLRLALLGLPLSAAVNILVKQPLAYGVAILTGLDPVFTVTNPVWYLTFLFMLAPVFEEAIKALPLTLGRFRKMVVDRRSALLVGMSLGIGFGLGEAAFIALSIVGSPQYAGYPWYLFTGYLFERVLTVFIHGVMTAVLVAGLAERRLWPWYLGAVGIHSVINLPVSLFQMGRLSTPLISAWILVAFGICVLVFLLIRRRSQKERSISEEVNHRNTE